MLTDKEAKSRTESSKISSTGIEHIAKLARIKLTEKEKDKFKKELSSVLDYVKKLNELDTDGVQPLYQTTGIVNALRPDEHRKDFEMDPERGREGSQRASASYGMNEKLNEKLIKQAPHSENRFIKVKSVLKK